MFIRRAWRENDVNLALELYLKGLRYEEIGKSLKRSAQSVERQVKRRLEAMRQERKFDIQKQRYVKPYNWITIAEFFDLL